MPRRRQPASLQQLAIKSIVASVVKLARRLMAKVYNRRRGLRLFSSSNHHQIKGIADLRAHLYDALPVSLCNMVCSQVMCALNTMAREQSTFDDGRKYVFCKLLETVLHPSIDYLNISDWPRSVAGVLLTSLKELTGLKMNLEFPVQTMLSMKNVSALRNLRLVDPDSEAVIDFVVKCCPYLTQLELVGSVDSLQPLSNLQYLQEISIDIGGLDGVNVIRILESANISKLKRLSICNGMNINLQQLGKIFVFLRCLDLKHCTFLETSSCHKNDKFTCLEVLTISSVDDNEVGRALVTILPQVVKSLHTLKLDIVMDPGSHIIGNILLANSMACLEILEIRGIVTMTVSTINRLIKTHESLKTIGKSEFWNRITKEDLGLLIDDLRLENIDLDIY